MKKLIALFILALAILNITACKDNTSENVQSSDITDSTPNIINSSETTVINTTSEADKSAGVKPEQHNKKPESHKDTSEQAGSTPIAAKPDKQQLILEENNRHNDVISDLESKKSYTADYYDRKILPLEGYNTEATLTQYTTEKQKLEGKKTTLEGMIKEYKASTRPEDAIAAEMLKEDLTDVDKQLKQLEILLEPYQEIIKLKEEKAAALNAIELEIEQENELHKKNLEELK